MKKNFKHISEIKVQEEGMDMHFIVGIVSMTEVRNNFHIDVEEMEAIPSAQYNMKINKVETRILVVRKCGTNANMAFTEC